MKSGFTPTQTADAYVSCAHAEPDTTAEVHPMIKRLMPDATCSKHQNIYTVARMITSIEFANHPNLKSR